MIHTPYPYQVQAVDYAADWHAAADPGARLLLAGPTGSGKSVVMLMIKGRLPGAWIVTPKLDIAAGFLTKLGIDPPAGEQALHDLAWRHCITTPMRLRNRLLAGDTDPPDTLLMDECHHDGCDTYADLHALCGHCKVIGFSATPYGGTIDRTRKLRLAWGEPVWMITYPQASKIGLIGIPSCTTLALVDDDTIGYENGDFVITESNAAFTTRMEHIVGTIAKDYWPSDKPTMLTVPGLAVVDAFRVLLRSKGVPTAFISASTSQAERRAAFAECLANRAILVHYNTIGEGVDLPLRRWIDCGPIGSPVRWAQMLGRITRPGGPSEYICTNRNLLRHGYLLDGCLPELAFRQSEAAFGSPGRRAGARALGLESMGRIRPAELTTKSGLTVSCYAICSRDGKGKRVDYFAFLHPAREEVQWAHRVSHNIGGVFNRGRWVKCEPPTDLAGFASLPNSKVTEPMLAWWKKSAGYYGLDPTIEPTTKTFQALPVLANTGIRL